MEIGIGRHDTTDLPLRFEQEEGPMYVNPGEVGSSMSCT